MRGQGSIREAFACVQAVSLHTRPLPCLETSFFPFSPFTLLCQPHTKLEGYVRIFTPTPEGKYVYKKSGEFISLFFYMPSFYVLLLLFHSRQPVFQDRMIKALH